jgi:hypothetical protein
MKFSDFRLLYLFICVGLGLIILSPTLFALVTLPGGESFSTLWILGPTHTADYSPFNAVIKNRIYSVYLGIENHMGKLEYYEVNVKFRNQTEFLPDTENGTSSGLEPLLEYYVFLNDNETWERPILFSLEGVHFVGNQSMVSGLNVNGCSLNVNKVALWDQENHGFYYELFFELWFYNTTVSGFQFHNRFVGIYLNVTGI